MIEDIDFPNSPAMTDPHVYIYLVGGDGIVLEDVSIVELSRRLGKYGFAYLSDGRGGYLVLFAHGVAAIQASPEAIKSNRRAPN